MGSKRTHDFYEAPTVKRTVPDGVRSPQQSSRIPKAEIEAATRPPSGTWSVVTDEELERHERRETRETLPAPPDDEAAAPVTVPRPIAHAPIEEPGED